MTKPETVAEVVDLEALRAVEDEEQTALEAESQALIATRVRLEEIAGRDLTIATKRRGVSREEHFAEIDRLSNEADRLNAEARRLESRVTAATFRRDSARTQRADAEAPRLIEAAADIIGDLVLSAGAFVQQVDRYIAERSRAQAVLRDSSVHVGSVRDVYPRPSGFTEVLLRAVEDAHGASHG